MTDLRISYRRSIGIILLATMVAIVVATVMTAAENTPPEVTVTTPEEGALLGLAVTVSGKATDAEGFNFDSYVQARWNDWEWFLLPNTPADGNRSIVFGEMVNLDFHSPGEHLLQVRAFDGELFSGVHEVNVTVRDLPDLVIFPSDMTLGPGYEEGDDRVNFHIVVQNQGGEDVVDVKVSLHLDGVEVQVHQVGIIEGGTNTTVVFPEEVRPGKLTVEASAFSIRRVQEKSLVNNVAEREFTFPEVQDDDYKVGWGLLGVVMVIGFLLIWLVMFVAYRGVLFSKD